MALAPNTPSDGIAWLAQGHMNALRDMQRTLDSRGMASELMNPPTEGGSCSTGGCGTRVWLAVANVDLPNALQALQDDWASQLAPEAVEASSMVVDLDSSEATCPACL